MINHAIKAQNHLVFLSAFKFGVDSFLCRNQNSKNPDINIGTDQYNASSSPVIDPCDRNLYWIYDRNLSRK